MVSGLGRCYRGLGLSSFLGTRSLGVARERRLGDGWKQALRPLQSIRCGVLRNPPSLHHSLHLPSECLDSGLRPNLPFQVISIVSNTYPRMTKRRLTAMEVQRARLKQNKQNCVMGCGKRQASPSQWTLLALNECCPPLKDTCIQSTA